MRATRLTRGSVREETAGDIVDIGRESAVDYLFRAHCAALVRLAYCLLGERETAEDVVQEAFVSLHQNWRTLKDKSATLHYLRTAVIHRCRSRQRQLVRARAAQPVSTEPLSAPSSEEGAIAHDEARRLAEAVQSLPTRQREVIVCRYYLELTELETATMLAIGLGSVKRHAHRGVHALSDRMGVSQ